MPSRVFVHAVNIHQGGGRNLLEALLKVAHDEVKFIFSLDDRMPAPMGVSHNIQIKRVKPTVMQRLNAEKWLVQSVSPGDIVLCFGNLPPLFKLRGYTAVFVQNRYLIDDVKLNRFPLGVRLRLVMERTWFSRKMSNVSEFIVQSPSMRKLLEIKTKGSKPVRVLPFVTLPDGYARRLMQPQVQRRGFSDFVYVASGEPHKNHLRLMEAWCLLAKEGIYPSLSLTLDKSRFVDLCEEIEVIKRRYGLKVKNAGALSHGEVLSLYKNSDALIYPSNFESFGLPLIEARQAGLPVLAPELDYVRDVVDPEHTFDAESSFSIAKAVKRFMGIDEDPLQLLDAKQFMQSVLGNMS